MQKGPQGQWHHVLLWASAQLARGGGDPFPDAVQRAQEVTTQLLVGGWGHTQTSLFSYWGRFFKSQLLFGQQGKRAHKAGATDATEPQDQRRHHHGPASWET